MNISIGKIFRSNNCGDFTVIKYNNCMDVIIEFNETNCRLVTQSGHIKRGSVNDPMSRSVYGVGFIGVGRYSSKVDNKTTKEYQAWTGMLTRCYSHLYQETRPTYKGCVVCEKWLNFQNFAKWHEQHYIDGCELDKDILGSGKLYSPSTCKFVTPQENSEKALAKNHRFISPDGVAVNVYNLTKFSRENDLHQGAMCEVHSARRPHHKGWTKFNGEGNGK